jgi:esterase/lipase superfamily enzyme
MPKPGRRKIVIERIPDDRMRFVTFTKRRFGVTKKAMELSHLGDAEVAVVCYSRDSGKWYQYVSSGDVAGFIRRWEENRKQAEETHSNSHVRYRWFTAR